MKQEEVLIGKARKFNQFSEGNCKENKSCATCIRKHFSFPYTCNDGWALGESNWRDRGSICINWNDNPQCQVD